MNTQRTPHCGDRQGLRRCPCCGRLLTTDDFYVNARTGRPDSRCKDCRREASRIQRSRNMQSEGGKKRRRRVVITSIADRDTRLELIRKALRTVAEIRRLKRIRLAEEADREAEKEPDE